MIGVELVVVLALIVLNGFLALSEFAMVASRRARLQSLAAAGRRGAADAMRLAEDPGRFLSTVQIGITLVGVLAGAYSGATLAQRLDEALEGAGLSPSVAEPLAYALVVTGITYLSLVFGELVPKRLALVDAERIGSFVARPMLVLSRIAAPFVTVLDLSTRACLKLIGAYDRAPRKITDEEIKALIAEAESTGAVEPMEKEMISGVMRLAERSVRAIMTPRPEVSWIDLDASADEIRATLTASRFSKLPVGRGTIDEVVGVVRSKDVMDAMLNGRRFDLGALTRKAPVVNDWMDAIDLLELLRSSEVHMALVVDEYGSLQGIVTATDILTSIVGAFHEPGEAFEHPALRREDGSWLFDGALPSDEMAERLAITMPEDHDYHTVAGFVLSQTGHVPRLGDRVRWQGWEFEVIDMDGRRVDKVLASRLDG
ncbi:MAG: HlyC/CorC family transporter [Alphaproteobacteria bacterium]|nr:HlyC/CorC family transporter [Alphaproteobacteria bacterium]